MITELLIMAVVIAGGLKAFNHVAWMFYINGR